MDEDQADDHGITLLQESAKSIRQIENLIRPLLFRRSSRKRSDPNRKPSSVRKHVEQRRIAALARLLDTFQESPQLLDPRLELIVCTLVEALALYMERYPNLYPGPNTYVEQGVEPLPRAACKLLYALCKVRGAKVVTRLFPNNAEHLDSVLLTFRMWERTGSLTWEEEYILLLWLSHLTQTPFDLDTVSSIDTGYRYLLSDYPSPTFQIPDALSNVAERLLCHALYYLAEASKAREAARLLLVRLSLRPDMQKLDLHRCCMDWALISLTDFGSLECDNSIHVAIGLLSYVAGFLKSGGSACVTPFILSTFEYIQDITIDPNSYAQLILESAVARMLIIKVYRSLAIHLLSGSTLPAHSPSDVTDVLNAVINHLLTSLRDKDNPVRFAASKALSMIAQRLDSEMILQLVDDIAYRFQENAMFEGPKGSRTESLHDVARSQQRNLAAVDPLQWQGLVLTLSHLLYRHSAPQNKLTMIMNVLVNALDFEQRSAMGKSIGASVRDAACFGIWSLARNYTTRELLRVAASHVQSRQSPRQHTSVLEVLAAELVLTATLDPEGNIRRGASAALQELVGRHPETIREGIQLIHVVDYHAVGLRSRALAEVSLQAAALDNMYLYALSEGLLSWRAINSPNPAIRRKTATVIGQVVRLHGTHPISSLQQRLQSPRTRSPDEWHGLYLALAATILNDRSALPLGSAIFDRIGHSQRLLVLKTGAVLSIGDIIASNNKAELAAEALCSMIYVLGDISTDRTERETLEYHITLLQASMKYSKDATLHALCMAAVAIFQRLSRTGQADLLRSWLLQIRDGHNGQVQSGGSTEGLMAAVGAVLCEGPDAVRSLGRDLRKLAHEVLVRLLDLLGRHNVRSLDQALLDCFDDYSTDYQGDVGSLVRMKTVTVVASFQDSSPWRHSVSKYEVIGRMCGLCVEKLDKVRHCAWDSFRVQRMLDHFGNRDFKQAIRESNLIEPVSTSSIEYFKLIIDLGNRISSRSSMIRGLITSAGFGSEALVDTARKAVLEYLLSHQTVDAYLFYASLLQVIQAAISDVRLVRSGLEVLAFLLEADQVYVFKFTFPGWIELLESMRSLHRSSDLPTLEAVIKVYSALGKHEPYQLIRLAAVTALWVIEPDEMLKSLDLTLPASTIRSRVRDAYGYR
ncbi:MAG: hypothetical protein Q9201_000644 [Fulgogasparrea decipioides]